tara:strand:+ start:784 stop:1680 length:897 start_codon:yes stop_codon:yes gene_type:complete
MDQKTTKSATNHLDINTEIVDCIKKLQSVNLFPKGVLSEKDEYDLLKEAKSENTKISQKAINKLSRYFSKFAFKQAKNKFETIGKKINFEDLFAEANLGILLAIKKFELSKWGKEQNGVKLRFSTYAQYWIKNTLNDYCLKNSSSIKFCTTKEDEKVFYNLRSTLNKLRINKSCSDLDNKEIKKVVKQLNKDYPSAAKIKDYNVKKYINSINISNCEKDIDNYYFNKSLLQSKEEQHQIESLIDAKKILTEKEYNVCSYYLSGYGLEKIAKELKSNKETVRQLIISSKNKLSSEKNFN